MAASIEILRVNIPDIFLNLGLGKLFTFLYLLVQLLYIHLFNLKENIMQNTAETTYQNLKVIVSLTE